MPTTKIIYAPILGQSNGSNMFNLYGNKISGASELERVLAERTGLEVETIFKDANGKPISPAIGGSTVEGTNKSDYAKTWWYPDSKQPGGALLRAVEILKNQYAQLDARWAEQGDVSVQISWLQGEASAQGIGKSANPEAAGIRYMEATRAVFDYIKEQLGVPVKFHIVKTDYMDVQGGLNEGRSQSEIDTINRGVTIVRQMQQKLADQYSDVDMSASMDDYTNVDGWHKTGDAYDKFGADLAKSIADSLGNVPPPPPPPPSVPSTLINGTQGNDKLIGALTNDVIMGFGGNDTLEGGAGNDTLVGGMGRDKMTGGEGADIFKILHVSESLRGPSTGRTFDQITDFKEGVDKIDLSALDFTGITKGKPVFGQLSVEYIAGSNRTYITDDFGTDFEIYLDGNHVDTLTDHDFIF